MTTDNNMRAHWERVYTDKDPAAVSWYQAAPERSLALIERAAQRATGSQLRRIVDVGGGASTLVDHLAQQPGVEVCVVDIAQRSLERAQERLGPVAARPVRWLAADATGPLDIADSWADLWHDRAAFHFLTDPEARRAYAANLSRILVRAGTVIIAGFAPDGPEKCSGLPVQRLDSAAVAVELSAAGRRFEVVDSQREEHTTPWGSTQRFVYTVMRG